MCMGMALHRLRDCTHVWTALLCWTPWKAAQNVFTRSMVPHFLEISPHLGILPLSKCHVTTCCCQLNQLNATLEILLHDKGLPALFVCAHAVYVCACRSAVLEIYIAALELWSHHHGIYIINIKLYVAVFMAHEGSRDLEALNFHWITNIGYKITTPKINCY